KFAIEIAPSVDASSPNGVDHALESLRRSDLTVYARSAELNRPVGVEAGAFLWPEPNGRAGFDIGNTVVLDDSKLVVDRGWNWLTETTGQCHMSLVVQVDEVFDPELPAKQARVARCTQEAERQNIWIQRIEDVHLITGRDSPFVSLQFPKGIDRQKP